MFVVLCEGLVGWLGVVERYGVGDVGGVVGGLGEYVECVVVRGECLGEISLGWVGFGGGWGGFGRGCCLIVWGVLGDVVVVVD